MPGDPTATVSGGVMAVARGTDNRIYSYHRRNNAGTYTIAPIPGLLAGGDPAIVSRSPATTGLQVFVRGQDGTVFTGNAGGTLRVYGRGTDHALYVNALTNGTTWSGWQSLGGIVTGNPLAFFGFTAFQAQVSVRGTDNALYVNTLSPGSNSRTGYTRVPGPLACLRGVIDRLR